MKMNENEWKWMKMNENEWKWMKMNEKEWKRMKMNENEWKWITFTCEEVSRGRMARAHQAQAGPESEVQYSVSTIGIAP